MRKRYVTVVAVGLTAIGLMANRPLQAQTLAEAQSRPGADAINPAPPEVPIQPKAGEVVQTPPVPTQSKGQETRQTSPEAQAQARVEEIRSRVQVGLMETALRQSVTTAASRLMSEVIAVTQGQAEGLLLRAPQAQGFRLGDYGTFFYVLVPSMRSTAIVALSTLREDLRRAERARVTAQSQPANLAFPVSSGRPAEAAEPPIASPFEANVLNDPQGSYVRSVKKEIIEAMIENSSTLRIPPNGFLTVAARSDTPPNPLDPTDEVRTMIFSVKGSDLDAYHQRRIGKDAVLKLVSVTED